MHLKLFISYVFITICILSLILNSSMHNTKFFIISIIGRLIIKIYKKEILLHIFDKNTTPVIYNNQV